MKFVAIPLALLLMAATAVAEQPVHLIGYVNVPWILKNSPQVQDVEAGLKKSFESREEGLRQRQAELDAIEEKLREEGAKRGDEETRQLERELVSGKRRLKIAQQEFQEDLALRQNEEINKLRRQISEVIQTVSKDKGLDLVFETAVVYVSDRVDISKDVLERLKSQQTGNGAAAPAPAH